MTFPSSFSLGSYKDIAAPILGTPVTVLQRHWSRGKPNGPAGFTLNFGHIQEAPTYRRNGFKLSQGNLTLRTFGGLYGAPMVNLICIDEALSEPPGMFEK
jgi:hypothetical protein